MRSFAFSIAYWALSIVYGLAAAFAALAPGRGATSWIIRRYVRRMVQAMRLFAGITIEARGKEGLPPGAFIIAGATASPPMTSSTTSPSSPATTLRSSRCSARC